MYALNGLGLTSTWTADDYRRWAAAQAAARVAAKRRPASSASAASGMAAARQAEAAAKAAAATQAANRAVARVNIAAATKAGESDIRYGTWVKLAKPTAAMKRAFLKARGARNKAIRMRAGSVASAASSGAAAAQAYREWKALQWAKKYIPLDGLGLAPITMTPELRAKLLKQAGRRRRQGLSAGRRRRPWIMASRQTNMAGLGEIESVVGGVLAVGAVAAAAYFLFGKQLGLKKNPRRRRRGVSRNSSRSNRLNDKEREIWVLNDEGLYNWWKRTRKPMREFIRAHRAELDSRITRSVPDVLAGLMK